MTKKTKMIIGGVILGLTVLLVLSQLGCQNLRSLDNKAEPLTGGAGGAPTAEAAEEAPAEEAPEQEAAPSTADDEAPAVDD